MVMAYEVPMWRCTKCLERWGDKLWQMEPVATPSKNPADFPDRFRSWETPHGRTMILEISGNTAFKQSQTCHHGCDMLRLCFCECPFSEKDTLAKRYYAWSECKVKSNLSRNCRKWVDTVVEFTNGKLAKKNHCLKSFDIWIFQNNQQLSQIINRTRLLAVRPQLPSQLTQWTSNWTWFAVRLAELDIQILLRACKYRGSETLINPSMHLTKLGWVKPVKILWFQYFFRFCIALLFSQNIRPHIADIASLNCWEHESFNSEGKLRFFGSLRLKMVEGFPVAFRFQVHGVHGASDL